MEFGVEEAFARFSPYLENPMVLGRGGEGDEVDSACRLAQRHEGAARES